MYRKPRGSKVEPMPKKQFRIIEKAFRQKGGIIQYGRETDRYLEIRNAEAITYDANTILIRTDAGRAAVFEELIHTAQYRKGENNGSYLSRLKCEIAAQKKLLQNRKAYKLTENEIVQTRKALIQYEKELRLYNKNGGR